MNQVILILDSSMYKPTYFQPEQLQSLINRLNKKPENVEELLNGHKSIKFHKILSQRMINKFEQGKLKSLKEFESNPEFKSKIKTQTITLCHEIEQSIIKKKNFLNNKSDLIVDDKEDIFLKIPSRVSIANQIGNL